ncbi:AI-2E family transporter [Nitratireductor sp. ZSWI3]|uniref:AI-2E family transporter n=1 Tax=Nitratireductor sp. ZSWI3 TaxID=2966359 RepID=UPI00214FC67A|nr:AI-2E family transporter [Nitratireductor sp. ZSWI3]MCR4264699.1 AI-2E family transporter [Nitratireductor sp. ZSWI3]
MLQKRTRVEWTLGLRLIGWLVGILATLLVVAALRSTGWMSSTLALAFFTALAVWPVDMFIRHRLPRGLRWLGHVAALLLMLVVFALFLGGVVLAARQITANLPAYEDAARAWAERLSLWIAAPNIINDGGEALTGRLLDPVVGFASAIVQSTSNLAGVLSLIFFLVLMMLIEAPVLSAKLRSATSRRDGEAYRRVLLAIAIRVRWYLAVRTFLGLVTGLLYLLWSWWWGLDFVFVWGLLAFLLNYIPTIGSLVAGVLPIAFAFLQFGPWWAVLYGLGLLVIEQVMGNYVDPKLQGRELTLSPLMVLVALMFWTWVWGIAGALVAVPMTLVLMIVCAKIPALLPVALFLSNCRNAEELEAATTA